MFKVKQDSGNAETLRARKKQLPHGFHGHSYLLETGFCKPCSLRDLLETEASGK
jgi:hypothetical protein